MTNNQVSIITMIGIISAVFTCGLKQGLSDSCPIASAVSVIKGDAWKIPPPNETSTQHEAYWFQENATEAALLATFIFALCYCDDESRYTASEDIDDLRENCHHYIDRAGDLSLVVKLGRKSSKCQVNLHNAPPSTALSPFTSFAWNFEKQFPVEATIATQTRLTTDSHLSEETPTYAKHFGTVLNIDGDTTPTSDTLTKKSIRDCAPSPNVHLADQRHPTFTTHS